MRSFLKMLKKHPIVITFYFLYSLLCYSQYRAELKFRALVKADPQGHHIGFGEGIMFGWLYGAVATIIFIIILIANGSDRRKDKFYIWLAAIVTVQAVTLWLLLF